MVNEVFKNARHILFIDIGCGPFTSGLSFLHFVRCPAIAAELNPVRNSVQLEYYGIDNAASMRTLGSTLLAEYENTINEGDFRYYKTNQGSNYKDIPNLIGKRDKETVIILNCCYFFASTSINVEDFTKAIQAVVDNNPSSKILLFYQNAGTNADRVSGNYCKFKAALKQLSANETAIQKLLFGFVDEFESTNYSNFERGVNFQLLKNY